jgi:hypothetical protein
MLIFIRRIAAISAEQFPQLGETPARPTGHEFLAGAERDDDQK